MAEGGDHEGVDISAVVEVKKPTEKKVKKGKKRSKDSSSASGSGGKRKKHDKKETDYAESSDGSSISIEEKRSRKKRELADAEADAERNKVHLEAIRAMNDMKEDMVTVDQNGDGNEIQVSARTKAMMQYIHAKAELYEHSANYYTALDLNITLPTIIITACSGLLSFVSSTSVVPPDYVQYISLTVGFMATIATILASFGQTMKWDTKAEMFRGAAQQYTMLMGKVELRQYQMDPLIPEKGDGFLERSKIRESDIMWQQMIESEIFDVQKRMTFLPPYDMVQQWKAKGMIASMQSKGWPKELSHFKADLVKHGIMTVGDLVHSKRKDLEAIDIPKITQRKLLNMRHTEMKVTGFAAQMAELKKMRKSKRKNGRSSQNSNKVLPV